MQNLLKNEQIEQKNKFINTENKQVVARIEEDWDLSEISERD